MNIPAIQNLLPSMLTQITIDIAEYLNSSWALAFSSCAGSLVPLFVLGQHPDLTSSARNITNLMWREPHAMQLSGNGRPDTVPRIIYPLKIGATLCVLAFGPRRDGRDYLPSDYALGGELTKRVAGQRSEEWEETCAMQERLFPVHHPPVEGIDYFARHHPVTEVGTDFFDLISPEPTSLLVSLADVSEQSIPAAIITTGLQTSLRALARTAHGAVSTLLEELSHMVWELAPERFHAAMFLCQFDSHLHELRYSNAGHAPPLLIRRNREHAMRLEFTGPVLGLGSASRFGQRIVPLQPGDVFVAMGENASHEDERIVTDLVHKHRHARASELAERLADRLHCDADGTLVVVRSTAASAGQFLIPASRQRQSWAACAAG